MKVNKFFLLFFLPYNHIPSISMILSHFWKFYYIIWHICLKINKISKTYILNHFWKFYILLLYYLIEKINVTSCKNLFQTTVSVCLVSLRIFVYNKNCEIISERRNNQYCAQGRIPGASRFGKSWAIPEDAKKPPLRIKQM